MTRYVSFDDKLVMRQRMFGILDIVDQHDYENKSTPCQPSYSLSDQIDLNGWFDSTIVNMLHMCVTSMLANEKNMDTGNMLTNFVLDLYQKKTDVSDMITYLSAKKFLKLQEKQAVKIHKVPNYVLDDILILSGSLYKSFNQLWSNVTANEKRVQTLNDNLLSANEQFELAEEELTNLVELEKESFMNVINFANISMFTTIEHR